jgi:PAS domain S-box-containing protein
MTDAERELQREVQALRRENALMLRALQSAEQQVAERDALLRRMRDALSDAQAQMARDAAADRGTVAFATIQRQLEGQFRSLAESSSDIICRYDRSCRLVFANSGLMKLVRRPLQELLGHTPNEHYPDLRLARYQASLEAVIDSGAERDIELRLPDTGNGIRYHHIRIFPERGLHGETVGALALGRDVTDRKEAEDRLYASEQAFRTVVEHSLDNIGRYDLNFRRTYANPALLSLMQLSAADVVGKTPAEVSPFVDPDRYMKLLRDVVETRRGATEAVRLRDANGAIRWGHIMVVPELSPSGAVVSILAISRDIDELKRSESAFRTLAENAPDPIIRYDRQCRRLYVNPEFLRVCGLRPEQLLGKKAGEDMAGPKQIERRFRAKLREVMRTGVAAKFELNWQTAGKAQCWYVHAVPEYDANGAVQSGLTIWRDISEAKAAELRLRDSYDMLRELASRRETAREEERKRIARELHDELGQQLTALRMRASTLRMRFGPENPELARQIQDLLSLADDTMQVMRSVVTSLRPAALDAGIAAALEWLVAEFSRGAQMAYSLSVPDDMPPLSEDRAIALFRIVQEALTNVARHARAQHVHVTLACIGEDCLLEVRDDGRGFDPVATRKRSFGLAGMKERMLMLGGKIDIASAPGKGTRINVRMPWQVEGKKCVPPIAQLA